MKTLILALYTLLLIGFEFFLGLCSIGMALFGLITVAAWLIGYKLSGSALISRWQRYHYTEFQITMKKIKYANFTAILVFFLTCGIAYTMEFPTVVNFIKWLK